MGIWRLCLIGGINNKAASVMGLFMIVSLFNLSLLVREAKTKLRTGISTAGLIIVLRILNICFTAH
jgi:hypothetical protein